MKLTSLHISCGNDYKSRMTVEQQRDLSWRLAADDFLASDHRFFQGAGSVVAGLGAAVGAGVAGGTLMALTQNGLAGAASLAAVPLMAGAGLVIGTAGQGETALSLTHPYAHSLNKSMARVGAGVGAFLGVGAALASASCPGVTAAAGGLAAGVVVYAALKTISGAVTDAIEHDDSQFPPDSIWCDLNPNLRSGPD